MSVCSARARDAAAAAERAQRMCACAPAHSKRDLGDIAAAIDAFNAASAEATLAAGATFVDITPISREPRGDTVRARAPAGGAVRSPTEPV
jgi:hypothetical protein